MTEIKRVMTERNRRWALVFLGVAVAMLVLLSAGISEVELLQGQSFRLGRGEEGEAGEDVLPPAGEGLSPLVAALVAIFYLLLPISIIYTLLSPEARKRMLRSLLNLIWIVALYLVLSRRSDIFEGEFGIPSSGALPLPEALEPAEFVAEPSSGLVLVATLVLAVFLAALVVGILWFLWHRRRHPGGSLEQLALQAQEALDVLQAGGDVKDTVMRCYYNMLRVVRDERGIRRQRDVTPREFEGFLEEAGLPGERVRQLTRLFEGVRYGAKVAGEADEHDAAACLQAIVEACGRSS